jgi:hypothetical protein
VSAAASIAVHLRRSGYKIRLVTGTGVDVDATERDSDGELLDCLADASLTHRHDIPFLVDRVRRRGDGGLIIAVLGGLTVGEAESLGALRASGTTCLGFLLDPTTWLNLPEQQRGEADAHSEQAAITLLRSGWRVIDVQHGASLAALWPQTARGQQGFAWRAALAETVAPAAGGLR